MIGAERSRALGIGVENDALSAVILINHSCSDSMASCIGVNDPMISQQVVFGSNYTHSGI